MVNGRIALLSPSRRRMHSFAACSGKVHSPRRQANNAQCTHSSVNLYCNGPNMPPPVVLLSAGSAPHLIHGSLNPLDAAPKTVSRSVQPFLHSSPVCQHTVTQTTLHATSVVIGGIYTQRAGDVAYKNLTKTL